MNTRLILILGVTASGKGRLGFDLARQFDGEIISVDSMKVYRRMDIGTAKPSTEARRQVNYHLLDVVEPSEAFSVASFLETANRAIDDIAARGRPVIAVGGTALYIKALLYGLFSGPGSDEEIRARLRKRGDDQGLTVLHDELAVVDPTAAERINRNDARRIIRALEVYELTGKPISSFQQQFDSDQPLRDWTIIGLRRPKEAESMRINARARKMIDSGLVEEVKSLLAEQQPLSRQAAAAIGYAEIIDHLTGTISLDEAVESIKKNTRRLAKGQRTWFKTFRNVNWLDIEAETAPEEILEIARGLID